MIEVNLIPDVKQELIKAERTRFKVIAGSITIGIISLAALTLLAIYVFGVQTVRGSLADTAIKDGSTKLESVADLSKTLTIQNQLTVLDSLNDSKKVDSRIFDVLGAIIPPEPNKIQISNLSIDSSADTITIDGQAANSYVALEVFKKTIEGATLRYVDADGAAQSVPMASNVSIRDTSYGEDNTGTKLLRFTISFTYASELFSPLAKNISIVISIDGNVTDSYLGMPTSIFADRASDIEGDK